MNVCPAGLAANFRSAWRTACASASPRRGWARYIRLDKGGVSASTRTCWRNSGAQSVDWQPQHGSVRAPVDGLHRGVEVGAGIRCLVIDGVPEPVRGQFGVKGQCHHGEGIGTGDGAAVQPTRRFVRAESGLDARDQQPDPNQQAGGQDCPSARRSLPAGCMSACRMRRGRPGHWANERKVSFLVYSDLFTATFAEPWIFACSCRAPVCFWAGGRGCCRRSRVPRTSVRSGSSGRTGF